MQVTSRTLPTEPTFEPREMTFTIETQEQADYIYRVFTPSIGQRNHRKALNSIDVDLFVRDRIRVASGGRPNFVGAFSALRID